MTSAHTLHSGRAAIVEPEPLRWLRLAIYAYFVLWIFEGALRKWIVPGLSGPLLIIRDPLLLFIYGIAAWKNVFRLNSWLTSLVVISTLSIIVSIGLSKPPPYFVVIFGIHANFLHLPLILLLPQVFNYEDVKKMGTLVVWLAPPMALLVALQFLSGPGARLNTGAGGEGGMIETALGRIRPSGTFSFTTGLAEYSAMLAAFLFHHMLEKKVFPQLAFALAAPSLLVMVVMSGSRTTFALMALQLAAVFAIWIIKPRFMKSSVKLLAIGFLVVSVIGSVGVLKVGMDVITSRFTDSGGLKQGFLIRFLDEFKKPIEAASKAEIGGVGIGMGTNAASSLMYKMLRFNLGESELDRVIMEMGPILGFAYLIWRFGLTFHLFAISLSALRIKNNTLPLLLTTACFNDLMQGQFGQTTIGGYAVICAGFVLASTNRKTEKELMTLSSDIPAELSLPTHIVQISKYAEQLRAEPAETKTVKKPRKKAVLPAKPRAKPAKKEAPKLKKPPKPRAKKDSPKTE